MDIGARSKLENVHGLIEGVLILLELHAGPSCRKMDEVAKKVHRNPGRPDLEEAVNRIVDATVGKVI